MNVMQAIGGGTFLLVSGVLGIRLLWLAYRNRALPELLLGLSFLLGGTLGATIEANAGIVAGQGGDGGMMLAVGKGIIALVVLLTGGAYIGHSSTGAFATGLVEPLWFWVEFSGRILSAVWLGVEAWLYFGSIRRRVALGLADPIVANRFLLWTIASSMGVVFLCTSVPPLFLTEGVWVQIDMFVFAAAGLATASTYWLAFFPPDAYRGWIEARANAT